MARLAVDGTKSIYFEDLGGAGRALIMIHGWGMDNRCWDGMILPLQSLPMPQTPCPLVQPLPMRVPSPTSSPAARTCIVPFSVMSMKASGAQ